MAHTRDLWFKEVKDESGEWVKVRKARHGKGKRWLACWTDPDDRERSKAFHRKGDADRYAGNMETDKARGDYFDPAAGKVTLDSVAKRWLSARMVDPSSEIRYASVYRRHVEPTFGRRRVRSVKPSDIQAWLGELSDRYESSTVTTAYLVLQGVLDLAVADDAIKRNPAKAGAVQRPVGRSEEIVPWSDGQVYAVIDHHPGQYRALPVIGAACGLRAGELFGLAAEDIDLEENTLRVRRQVKKLGSHYVYALPKNDRERTVPLPEWGAATIRVHTAARKPRPYSLPWEKPDGKLRTYNLLFRWSDDRHIRARGYDELVWKPALAAAGIIPAPVKDKRGRRRYITDRRAGMHALRHYYASVMLAGGVSIRDLADFLGHGDPAFTLRIYTHMMPSSYERARAAIDERLFRPRAVVDGT